MPETRFFRIDYRIVPVNGVDVSLLLSALESVLRDNVVSATGRFNTAGAFLNPGINPGPIDDFFKPGCDRDAECVTAARLVYGERPEG